MTEETPSTEPRRGIAERTRELVQNIRGRSLLVRLAIAVVAITVFVLIPAYIATRPAFMERYPSTEVQYESWTTSVHAQVNCQSCHIPPNTAAQAGYSLRMVGQFYLQALPISQNPDLLKTPGDPACSSCHIDLRAVSPSGDLNIPHKAHVDELKIACIECHEFLVHETNPQGEHTPTMERCLKCHDGKTAKDECEACHNEKGAPLSHKATDWKIIHPDKQQEEDCESCHKWTENWCAQCHSTRPRSHAVDWRATHRDAVKQHRSCEACHEGSFCEKCHGLVPQLNFDSALKLVP